MKTFIELVFGARVKVLSAKDENGRTLETKWIKKVNSNYLLIIDESIERRKDSSPTAGRRNTQKLRRKQS